MLKTHASPSFSKLRSSFCTGVPKSSNEGQWHVSHYRELWKKADSREREEPMEAQKTEPLIPGALHP